MSKLIIPTSLPLPSRKELYRRELGDTIACNGMIILGSIALSFGIVSIVYPLPSLIIGGLTFGVAAAALGFGYYFIDAAPARAYLSEIQDEKSYLLEALGVFVKTDLQNLQDQKLKDGRSKLYEVNQQREALTSSILSMERKIEQDKNGAEDLATSLQHAKKEREIFEQVKTAIEQISNPANSALLELKESIRLVQSTIKSEMVFDKVGVSVQSNIPAALSSLEASYQSYLAKVEEASRKLSLPVDVHIALPA